MHVLYLTCPNCQHTGETRNPTAIQAHTTVTPFRVRCSECGHSGMADNFQRSLSFYKDVNPYRQGEGMEE